MGGEQVITLIDGYSTPLQCGSGLMYMSLLGKPTDAGINTFPHVLLTGPLVAQPKKYISKILDSFHQMFAGESLPQVKSSLY